MNVYTFDFLTESQDFDHNETFVLESDMIQECSHRQWQIDQLKRQLKEAVGVMNTIAELESRLEQSVDISVVNELNETIKAKDAEIENLRENFAFQKFEFIRQAHQLEEKEKAIAEARELINAALKITEERSFWIKDEFIMESEQVEEWREKAKAWLENNK